MILNKFLRYVKIIKIKRKLNKLEEDELLILKIISSNPYISKRKLLQILKKKYKFYSLNKLNKKIEKLTSLGLIKKIQYKRKWEIKEEINNLY